ncbi:phosphatase PAP2 family protein [Ramlibacter montanisoli]|uniref:Phosphatase PAP2 family protein n=1 Tax=Ramlibacter montanisoli TaxID=2732512 RepID=A0A849KFC4_9BURK|nr:phosphatase PAP2 family protein [Ramlibacter montanisoli]NNU45224.1 phosphatase PAP2 family protein [Ramlibacter montanisoli]
MGDRVRLALVLFCLAVLGLLAVQVLVHGPMMELDQAASHWFATHRHALLTRAMLLVSEMHRTAQVLAAAAVLALVLLRRGQQRSALALLAVPTGMVLNVGLKESFQRMRPMLDDPLVQLATYSFPSGHAVASTVFYGMACALVFTHVRSRAWRALAACFAVAMVLVVTFSRVYLGAHYPSDVVAGVAVGTICVVLFLRLLPRRAAAGTDVARPPP